MQTKSPPIYLDEAPPVMKNCTRSEVSNAIRFSGVCSIFLCITIFLFLFITNIFNSTSMVIMTDLILTVLFFIFFAYWIILKIGNMKNTKNTRYIEQQFEKYKNKLGMEDKRIIYRTGKWSTDR